MKQTSGGCGKPVLFFILGLLILVGLWAIWSIDRIPKLAERSFGAASPHLNVIDKTYYGTLILANQNDLLIPFDPGDSNRLFKIQDGESVNSVALRLEQEGLIANSQAFRAYLLYAGLDTGMKAGQYSLSASMTAVDIAHVLQSAITEEITFVLLAGWRSEEVAEALSSYGFYTDPMDFLDLVRNPPEYLRPVGVGEGDTLEGYLYPGEYVLKRKLGAEDIVRAFVNRFEMEAYSRLGSAWEQQGLTVKEAITLASIVEREAIVDDEMPTIASVFYNRLGISMKLDSDPTVQYAIGYNGQQNTWWTNPLSSQDLLIDSYYNTYQYQGLPPGPICNPGMSSLVAVAYPAQTPYYYFRAKCDESGRHSFAVTYEEHLQNGCP